jgi:hypothetical protein
VEFGVIWLSPRHDQGTTDAYQRQPKLGDHWKRAERSGRGDVEALAVRPMTEVFQAAVDRRHIVEPEFGRGGRDPGEAALLGVDQGERRIGEACGQREPGKAGAGPEVGPALLAPRCPDLCKRQCLFDVALSEPWTLARSQEAEFDRGTVGSLEPVDDRLPRVGGPWFAGTGGNRAMFHVKRSASGKDDH